MAEIDGIRAAPANVVALLRGTDTIGSTVTVALEKGGPGGRRAAFVLHRASMRGVARVGRCCVDLAELAGEVSRASPDRRVQMCAGDYAEIYHACSALLDAILPSTSVAFHLCALFRKSSIFLN